jgi:hypothetical protein
VLVAAAGFDVHQEPVIPSVPGDVDESGQNCHRERERRLNQVDPITAALHRPHQTQQWQGAGAESVSSLAPVYPVDIARRGYSVGTKVLQAALPEHDVPTAFETYEPAPSRRRKAGMPSSFSMSHNRRGGPSSSLPRLRCR